jgi:PEP-CTERM motif
MFAIGCLAVVPAFADITYVSLTNGAVDSINVATGALTATGVTSGAIEMTDIAFDNATGVMYGVSYVDGGDADSVLYRLNLTTGVETQVGTGNAGFALNGLTFIGGTLYATGGPSSCGSPPTSSISCGQLLTVNTTTGAATALNTNGTTYNSSGDIEYVNGVLYVTSTTGSAAGDNDTLDTLNTSTGARIADLGTTGFQFIYGLANVGGVLYGFNDVGNHVLTLNLSTGAATSVTTYSGSVEITGATDVTPEPGTLGVMGIGLISLAGFAARLRRR